MPKIEFWFEFGSNYSYLSVMRVERLAQDQGVRIAWKPFLLGPVFQALGWKGSPFVLQREKGIYVWKDMARQCEKYGIPWRKPSLFPRLCVLPMRVMLVGEGQPWIPEFARQVMLLNFYWDRDINSAEEIGRILDNLGQSAENVIADAQHPSIKEELRARTQAARERGIFGAPTFFVNGEMFWGNDRLDDALQLAASGRVDLPA
jgi:2-hydroxychromene-2-carboxylate isomerase